MKILLIDNEDEIRTTLKTMVESVAIERYEIAEANGVATGLEMINNFNPNIVFLDVEMNDGTGFDLLKRIAKPNFQLIFTTAHNQYALQALKCSAIDYLLKPIDPTELKISLQKAIAQIDGSNMKLQLEVLLNQLSLNNNKEKQIVLKDIDKTYFVKINDILYCEADGSYTKFYFKSIDPILVSHNLRSYEELLEPSGFIRTHHSCLVNPQHIKIYDRKTDGGVLILEGGFTVPVSQRKKDVVAQLLEKRG